MFLNNATAGITAFTNERTGFIGFADNTTASNAVFINEGGLIHRWARQS